MDTVPTGLQLLMDRTPMNTPFTLDWGWDTPHTVGALPSQRDDAGHLMIFDSWSDGGDINHVFRMPGPGSTAVSLTAHFVPGATVSFLTSPPGLSLNVDNRSNWQSYNFAWPAGSVHSFSAPATQVDAQGHKYKFVSWSNNGDAAQQITVMTAPDDVRYTATYAPVAQISVTSVPPGVRLRIDGADCVTPCAVERDVGATVHLSAPPVMPVADGSRLVFQGWADSGSPNRDVTGSPNPLAFSASYQMQYLLSTAANPADGVSWRATPSSSDGYYDAQTSVSLAADVKPGYRFLNWDGDVAGSTRPAVLTMSSPKSVLAVLQPVPFVNPGDVKNAAGDTPDATVAPGSVITVWGINLAPGLDTSPASALKQVLSGVTLRVGGEFLPLFFVSPNQINAQLPSDIGEGAQTLTISSAGAPDVQVTFTVARNAPGLFANPANDTPFAVAAHADGSPVTSDNPARQGETVTLFGTGFGPYVGPTPDGFALPESPNSVLADAVDIVAGDQVLQPDYAGIAAGKVGVNALRFVISNALSSGTNVSLKVRVNGHESNTVVLPLQ